MTATNHHGDAPMPATSDPMISLLIDSMFHEARQIEGGHLWISDHEYRLYCGRGRWVTGYTPDRALRAAIAVGVPIIDVRGADQDKLYDVIVKGPIAAVGEAPVQHRYLCLSSESLADYAERYRAIGAALLNMPTREAGDVTEPQA